MVARKDDLGLPMTEEITDIGPMKAYTAASFRTPTHQLAENNLENPARIASLPNVLASH
jgi:uncharacterized protein GlcG (DUF336 family)